MNNVVVTRQEWDEYQSQKARIAQLRAERDTVSKITYSAARPWAAEGARVALISCLLCGAAILIDPADETSSLETHTAWHKALEQKETP